MPYLRFLRLKNHRSVQLCCVHTAQRCGADGELHQCSAYLGWRKAGPRDPPTLKDTGGLPTLGVLLTLGAPPTPADRGPYCTGLINTLHQNHRSCSAHPNPHQHVLHTTASELPVQQLDQSEATKHTGAVTSQPQQARVDMPIQVTEHY